MSIIVLQGCVTKQLIITNQSINNMPVLTEGGLDSKRCRLLGFITETQLIDGLHTEHVCFSFCQTTNHKPEEQEQKYGSLTLRTTDRHVFCLTDSLPGALVRLVIG